ncbi:hypothetical protein ACE939_03915 [Aquimarina sp. W85]|uniref:hypothetical protein n=1 Tax=Aquimarina rhodophyticola TaxID=3342246 RepID=UPI00366B5BB0
MGNSIIETHNLDFCSLELYDDYMKVVVYEGVCITLELNNILTEIATQFFKQKPFLYITHRIHSYAVDPTVYFETSQIKNLVAFIIVSNQDIYKKQFKIERTFFKKEFKYFETLEKALAWKEKFLLDK